MTHNKVLENIHQHKIIAIIRGDMRGREIDIAKALIAGGITAIEVSLISRSALQMIQNLVTHLGEIAAIGAGTVLSIGDVDAVKEHGASFIVSPNTDKEVIERTRTLGMASFPGAYTPTEIVQATQWGADAVKIFPALALGPEFVSALRGPFPGLKTVPTGGVTSQNAGSYIRAGAWALGIGSELVRSSEARDFNAEALAARACTFAGTVRETAAQ
jgi:2-dehydro-3-deoxyphosphogluconate aldolase/(4S)-4-hydroxy-2-oxoglutarate aldolase